MKANFTITSPGNTVTRIISVVIMALAAASFNFAAAQTIGAGTAPVNPPTGGFAIDGNLQANVAVVGVGDWLTGALGTGGFVLDGDGIPLVSATTFHLVDAFTTKDNIFGGGDKVFFNPNDLSWETGAPNDKTDMNNALIHFTTDATGHVWVVFAADRLSNGGNAYMDFEFLQAAVTKTYDPADITKGKFYTAAPVSTGGRTLGDFLLTVYFENGVAKFDIQRWEDVSGTWQYNTYFATLPASSVLAAGNTASVAVPYPVFGGYSYSSNTFIEAAVDLTEVLGEINPCFDIKVRTIFVKSKTSTSPSAAIKDFFDPLQVSLFLASKGGFVNGGTAICPGSPSGLLTLSGHDGLVLRWESSVAPYSTWTPIDNTSTTYTSGPLSVTTKFRAIVDGKCGVVPSEPTTVTVNALPVACPITGPESVCPSSSNSFSGPPDMASYAWSLTTPNGATISDGADQLAVTVVAPPGCSTSYVLSLTVTDANGCQSIACTKTVTVTDITKPTVTAGAISSCYKSVADAEAASIAATTYNDNCTDHAALIVTAATVGDCPTATVTVKVKDLCNNEESVTYTTSIHTADPSEFGGPVSVKSTVGCAAAAALAPTTLPVVKDFCGTVLTAPTPTVSVDPACEGTKTYTYIYKDCANREFTWIYTYTIERLDFTMPADQGSTVACIVSATAPTPPAVTDNCSNPLTPTGPVIAGTFNGCEGTRTFTWTYTDCEGNTHDWVYTYTIERLDFTIPGNQGSTVACIVNATAPTPPAVTDNCSNALTPTGPVTSGNYNGCEGTRTFTWTYTDCESNTHDWVYTYTIERLDFTMPGNQGSTVACIANATAPTPPVVTDNCSNTLTPTGPVTGGTYNGCEGTRTYTWTYTDCEGNTHNWVYTYTIERLDFTMPGNTGSTVACIVSATAPTPPAVTDNCSNALTPTGPVTGGTYNGCEGTRTFTWTYTDCEGNTHDWVYTYTVERADFTPPANDGKEIACAALAVTPTPPTVNDNCGNLITPTGPTMGGTYAGCEGTITYTYNYKDCEGNNHDWVYTYTIERADFTMPGNTGSTVACVAMAVLPSVPEVKDNCGNVLTPAAPVISEAPAFRGIITYTFAYTDCEGNTHNWIYTYTIDDKAPPIITCQPDISKSADPGLCQATIVIIDPTANDNCSTTFIYTGVRSDAKLLTDPYPTGTTFITWTATDPSGNISEKCVQTITVTDDEPPVILTCSPNKTAPPVENCQAAVPDFTGEIIVSDNCTGRQSLVITQSPVAGTLVGHGVTNVTITVKDAAGNTDSCIATFTVLSTIAATNDSGTLVENGTIGGTSFVNVLWNDKLNCDPATLENVTIKFISATHQNVTLSGTDVVVAAGTPTGDYELVYQICEIGNPGNCQLATVTVPVLTPLPASLLIANNDAGSANGITGGVAVPNVLVNDTFDGVLVLPGQVNPAFVSSTSPKVTLSGSQVIVAAGTLAGVYYLTYKICEEPDRFNCSLRDAIVTVIVTTPTPSPRIDAIEDAGAVSGIPGGVAVPNILVNDKLNGVPILPGQVNVTFISTSNPNVTLVGTTVVVAPNTQTGVYYVNYQICELGNPTNCDATIITVNVKAPVTTVSIVKTAVENTFSAVGDLIHYNIVVTNTSTEESYYTLTVADPNAEIKTGNPIGTLAPGKSATVTAIHTVTQSDLDAGKVVNISTLSGFDLIGLPFSVNSNTVTVFAMQRPQITITKFATEITYHKVGDVIHYTFEIFNCGNVTASNIVVTDPKATNLAGNLISSLAPRQTVTATAERVVTQADLDADSIANIAYAKGFDPTGKPVRDDSNVVTTYANQPVELLVSKFADETSFSAVGDVINYTIFVMNYLNTTVSDVLVTDPNATITSGGEVFRLASGEAIAITAKHVITQKDLDAGKVVNVATARGRDFYNVVVKATSNEVTVFANQSPLLSLVKTADETTFSNVGDLIHYTHTITNNGNVKITGIALTDPGTTTIGSNQVASLDPGESVTIKTSHTISLADLNAGSVDKTASVSAFDANTQPIRVLSNQVTVKGVQNSQLATTLTAAESTFVREGEMIHYTIEVRNTGNVTLTNLNITDAATGSEKATLIPNMVPGSVSVVTIEHMINQIDVYTGKLVNLATATGYNPAGVQVSNQSNELTILANQAMGLLVTKIAQESSYAQVGEVIHYIISIKNNGSVPLSNITVSVPDAIISGNPVINLTSKGSATILAMHTITQFDLDAGQLISAATASGTNPDGTVILETSNPVVVYGLQDPQLNTAISALETSYSAVGQEINYTIEIKNTGNVTLTDIGLSSEGNLVLSGSPVNLAPGLSAQLSALYVVTVADMDAGAVVKSVYASGMDPVRKPVAVTSNEITVNGLQNPELSTVASSMETTYSKVGEVIHYTITVKNSGNVSIISTAVTDPNAVVIDVRPNTILLPGESFVVAASHTVTQDDINAGKVVSIAKAEGFDLNGNTITKLGNKVTVIGLQISELLVESTTMKPDFSTVGEVIEYTIKIKNQGNMAVFNLGVADPNAVINLEQPVSVLQPGETTAVSASHVVTQSDMDAGEVVNVANASAVDMNGKEITAVGNKLFIDGQQVHELTTTTEPSVTTYSREGDAIVYTVLVRNTGNVTMKDISISDAKEVLTFGQTIPVLAPGESASVVTEYKITLDDVNSGKLVTAPEAACFDINSLKFSYLSNDVTVRLVIVDFNLTNFPNPFAYETTIVFDLPEKAEVILKVFDMTGREVGQIDQKEFNEGRNFVNWKTFSAQKGLYFLRMTCNGSQAVRILSILN